MKKLALFGIAVLMAMALVISCENNVETKSFTVTFDTDGGSEIAPVKVLEGAKLTAPEAPFKGGHRLVEWQLEGKTFDFNSPITKDITLKAIWEEDATVWDGKSIDADWYTGDKNEYTLTTAAQLAGLTKLVDEGNSFKNKTIVLANDINLGNYDWRPIGTVNQKRFSGTFDGGNNTISNAKMVYDADDKYGGGFFADTAGATIKNITFTNCSSNQSIMNINGIVAGYSYGTTLFENVHVKDCEVTGFGKVGGLLGMAADPQGVTTFKNCSVENITIHGVYDVGGLVGLVQNKLEIDETTTVGTINWEPEGNNVYVDVDSTINCGESCPLNGLHIEGKYWNYKNEYYYGGFAKYAVMFQYKSHHCTIEGDTIKLANTERLINDLSQLEDYNNTLI